MSKELKPYRSKAEKIAMHQRWIQITLTLIAVIVNLVTLARVFGLI